MWSSFPLKILPPFPHEVCVLCVYWWCRVMSCTDVPLTLCCMPLKAKFIWKLTPISSKLLPFQLLVCISLPNQNSLIVQQTRDIRRTFLVMNSHWWNICPFWLILTEHSDRTTPLTSKEVAGLFMNNTSQMLHFYVKLPVWHLAQEDRMPLVEMTRMNMEMTRRLDEITIEQHLPAVRIKLVSWFTE